MTKIINFLILGIFIVNMCLLDSLSAFAIDSSPSIAIKTPKDNSKVIISTLQTTQNKQQSQILDLQKRLDQQIYDFQQAKNEKTLADWLLTFASFALTILTIFLGTASIFGFNSLKEIARDAAEKGAEESVSKTLQNKLEELSKPLIEEIAQKTLDQDIRDGKLDKVITDAIDKIAFSSIEDEDPERNENEHGDR